MYDTTLNANLIQKDKLVSESDINHLNIYIWNNATLSTIGAIKIPSLDHSVEFNVIIPDIDTSIARGIRRSFTVKLNLPIPVSVN